jgi:transcriptional regulator with XRE-family HTH domain
MTGEELKAALSALGWKQADLARATQLHRNTVNAWASDGPPPWVAQYLAALLAIKGLYEAFVVTPRRAGIAEDDGPQHGSRAARALAALQAIQAKSNTAP